jgi:hypothetical protein
MWHASGDAQEKWCRERAGNSGVVAADEKEG